MRPQPRAPRILGRANYATPAGTRGNPQGSRCSGPIPRAGFAWALRFAPLHSGQLLFGMKGDCEADRAARLWSQGRSRFFRTKGIKTAISPTTISIQYWPSNPRKEKCSVRNCNVSPPSASCAEQALCLGKISIKAHEIYYFYTIVGGRNAVWDGLAGPRPARDWRRRSIERRWRRSWIVSRRTTVARRSSNIKRIAILRSPSIR